jgi:hypothetical protein
VVEKIVEDGSEDDEAEGDEEEELDEVVGANRVRLDRVEGVEGEKGTTVARKGETPWCDLVSSAPR